MRIFNILLAALFSLLFVGCASTLKKADGGLEQVHRGVNDAYETIRKFTDPLPLPFKLEPIDPAIYNDYKHESSYQFEKVANPDQRYCVVKGLPTGSYVEIFYVYHGFQEAFTVYEKGGKARFPVPMDTTMHLRVTHGWTAYSYFFHDRLTTCDYKWREYQKDLKSKCPKEED